MIRIGSLPSFLRAFTTLCCLLLATAVSPRASAAAAPIPTPFLQSRGIYAGVISTVPLTAAGTGYLEVDLAATGVFTGRLRFGLYTFTFKNQFNSAGSFSGNLVAPGGKTYLRLSLTAPTDGSGAPIVGSLTLNRANPLPANNPPPSTWSVSLPQVSFPGSGATPFAGVYTAKFPAPSTASTVPQGFTTASVRVLATGRATAVGTLGDGTAVTIASFINFDGSIPFYIRPYSLTAPSLFLANFSLASVLSQQPSPSGLLSVGAQWIKPARRDPFYPQGFSLSLTGSASAYVAPTTDSTPLTVFVPTGSTTNLTLTYNAGGLYRNHAELGQLLGRPAAGPYQINIPPTASTRATYLIYPATGLFTGTYYDPLDRARHRLSGVFIQGDNTGAGVFRSSHYSGSILIQGSSPK